MYRLAARHQEHSTTLPNPTPNPTARSSQYGSSDPIKQTIRSSEPSDDHMDVEYADGHGENVNPALHSAQFLQHAARCALQDRTASQSEVFRSLAPLVTFLWILGVAAFLPRKYAALERKYGAGDLQVLVIIGVLGGIGVLLLVLRGGIWFGSVLVRSFCDADLLNLFQKGEMVDSEGVRMGDADIVLGSLFQ